LNSPSSAGAPLQKSSDAARSTVGGTAELAKTLRALAAEMEATPQRWRRAARIALITALGAGVTAALQISNALGLTLLFNFGAPEMAPSFRAACRFLAGAALCQAAGLALAGAMADSAIPHLTIFAALSLVSGYLIYADPRVGRLWVWVQVPVLTAFYLVVFDPGGFGWTDVQAFGAVAVAVAILYVSNTLLWPRSAAEVLSESLADTVDRSRRRLGVLLNIWMGVDGLTPADDRPVASKLGYHLTLLGPAAHDGTGPHALESLLSAMMTAERIHNEVERIADLVNAEAGEEPDEGRREAVRRAGQALDEMLEWYAAELGQGVGRRGRDAHGGGGVAQDRALGAAPRPTPILSRLHNIAALLELHPADAPLLPADAAQAGDGPNNDQSVRSADSPPIVAEGSDTQVPALPERPRFNPFLIRYTLRHTIAMVVAFICGLFANNPAMHAALWLLMIGGPPSHGATVRKFTIRAIGAALALVLAALGTILLAPNGTTVSSYMVAIFAGSLLMAYIGQGGGLLSFLSIGGTAFVIAFSGPGPRNDAFASIWTIWGISFGMLIRAVVSLIWRERPRRTLVEEFQPPLEALTVLASTAHRGHLSAVQVGQAQMVLIDGIREMLGVAADAQLEGRGAGIDAANLVDALDTLRRVGLLLARQACNVPNTQPPDSLSLRAALHARFADWLESLRVQNADGVPSLAPLREMVLNCDAPALAPWAAAGGEEGHLLELVRTLEEQLKTVSVY